MKRVIVTYQMTRKIEGGRDTTETGLILPMSDENAQELIESGEESATYLVFVHDILKNLSMLQDHEYVGFCSAELAGEKKSEACTPKEPRYRIVWNDFKGNEHESRCSSLETALEELRYLQGCPTRGPVRLEEIR